MEINMCMFEIKKIWQYQFLSTKILTNYCFELSPWSQQPLITEFKTVSHIVSINHNMATSLLKSWDLTKNGFVRSALGNGMISCGKGWYRIPYQKYSWGDVFYSDIDVFLNTESKSWEKKKTKMYNKRRSIHFCGSI